MKRYENPMMNVTLFDTENVVTTASGGTGDNNTPETSVTAVDQAVQAAGKLENLTGKFTVTF